MAPGRWLALLCAAPAAAQVAWRQPTFDVAVNRSVVYAETAFNCTPDDASLPRNLSDVSSCRVDGGGKWGRVTLDLYAPAPRPGGPRPPAAGRPAVVLMHGGSYVNGDSASDNMAFTARWYAARGFVAASLDYRPRGAYGLVPAGDFKYEPEFATHDVNGTMERYGFLPAFDLMYPAVRDAKAAVRWLKANAELLGVAPDFVVAYGSSAGACSAVALGSRLGPGAPEDYRDELRGVDPTLGHLDTPSDVAAVVSHWGGLYALEVLEQATNVSRVTAAFSPVVAFHGSEDYAISPLNEPKLCDRLSEFGVPCEATTLRGYGHDPTFSCACCNSDCSDTGVVNCTGRPVREPGGGCEVVVDASTNATMDDATLRFLAAHVGLELRG